MRLLMLVLLAVPLAAQSPPPKADITMPKPVDRPTTPPKEPTALEQAVADALRQHPDVKLADAKRAVADAEYEQTRLLVTQRITNAFAKVEQAKARKALAEAQLSRFRQMEKQGQIPLTEMNKIESEMQTAIADLAMAEADLQAAKGGNAKPAEAKPVDNAKLWQSPPPAGGSAGNSLLGGVGSATTLTTSRSSKADLARSLPNFRVVLDQKIKLDFPGEGHDVEKLLAALREASRMKDLLIRVPSQSRLPYLRNYVGEQTMQGWLDMIMDDIAVHTAGRDETTTTDASGRKHVQYMVREPMQIYVRDYGLLITPRSAAPADALTLAEYAAFIKSLKPNP
jgi:hypothetical protein